MQVKGNMARRARERGEAGGEGENGREARIRGLKWVAEGS